MKILMVTRKSDQCGVADYGKRVFDILKGHFSISLAEVNNADGVTREVHQHRPDILLYNYHYATLPFITDDFIRTIPARHVAIFHEAHLNFTPDKILDTSIRPLFENIDMGTTQNNIPTIGSFGFGFPEKDFPRVASTVSDQYDKGVLRLNIPFAEFGDKDGYLARREADKVRAIVHPGIELHISHDYLSQVDLLKWLERNDLNLFLYKPSLGRGLASATDYALSVKKPVGVSASEMFRHLPPEICVDNTRLKDLSLLSLEKFYQNNSNNVLIDYYRKALN